MKLVLDANFLLLPGQFKIDIFEELMVFGKPDLYTKDLVVEELEKLAKGKSKDAKPAQLSLDIIKQKKIKVLKAKLEKADDELIRLGKSGFVICTQDRAKSLKFRTYLTLKIFGGHRDNMDESEIQRQVE